MPNQIIVNRVTVDEVERFLRRGTGEGSYSWLVNKPFPGDSSDDHVNDPFDTKELLDVLRRDAESFTSEPAYVYFFSEEPIDDYEDEESEDQVVPKLVLLEGDALDRFFLQSGGSRRYFQIYFHEYKGIGHTDWYTVSTSPSHEDN